MNATINKPATQHYITSVYNALDEIGVTCEILTDFSDFLDTCRFLNGKARPISLFDPREGEVQTDNSFWIKGTDRDGQIVHVQAMKHFHTGIDSLADHFEKNARLFMIQDCGIDLGRSEFHDSPCTASIWGSVCYHGEIWLHKKLRSKALTLILPRLAIVLAHQRWNPDYMVGFTHPKHSYKGIAVQYGYMHCQMGAINWYKPKENEYEMDWLVWLTNEELDHLIKYPAREERAYFVPDRTKRAPSLVAAAG